jgi:hypothetical protein
VSRLSLAFAEAARKTPGAGAQGGAGDASNLGTAWQTRIPQEVVSLDAIRAFVEQIAAAPDEERPPGLFGPPVHVTDDAPLLDRVVGLSRRDPTWSRG